MKAIESKVLILGAQGVGKSSLALRLARRGFYPNLTPTIGAGHIHMKEEIGDHVVQLQFWDTAGQERFKALIPMYFRKCKAAVLVYDVTDVDSFRAAEKWENELQRNAEEGMVRYVVGNKKDLPRHKREVDQTAAKAFAFSIGGHFMEVSALNNLGIDEMRTDLCVKLILFEQEERRRRSESSSSCWTDDSAFRLQKTKTRTKVCCF